MTRIYANLCGTWCCLNDDLSCVMGTDRQSPLVWYEENAAISDRESNNLVSPQNKDSYYNLDYIHIYYRGKDYRISPVFIQIVNS